MQHIEEQLHIGHVQTDGRLFEQIKCRSRLAHFANAFVSCTTDAALELRDEFEPLRFTAAQGRAGLPEFKITEPRIDEQGERFLDLRMGREKFGCFLDRHLHHVANRFFVVEDFQCLWIVAAAFAILAWHKTARQKIHLQFDHALAFARFATATLRIERKTARGITAHARDRQLRVEIPNLIEDFNVGPRRRARSLADGRLINLVNGLDWSFIATRKQIAHLSSISAFVDLLASKWQQHLVHQGRFSRAGDSGDDGKPTDRKADTDIFQVINAGAADFDPALNLLQGPPRFPDRMAE